MALPVCERYYLMETTHKVQKFPFFSTKIVNYESREENIYHGRLKRAFDLILFLIVFPLIMPVLFFLTVLIKITSPGPAMYKSEKGWPVWKKVFLFKVQNHVYGC